MDGGQFGRVATRAFLQPGALDVVDRAVGDAGHGDRLNTADCTTIGGFQTTTELLSVVQDLLGEMLQGDAERVLQRSRELPRALAQCGVQTRVFEAQDADYREAVLGSAPRIAVEAAARMGWDRWTGPDGVFIGMDGFGASAPAAELYEHFGITSERVAGLALELTGRAGA